ncbi:MAG: hypothetical protein NZ853_06970 [Leptospiraceae bacterium]|nr:hypothetical protein [Leptospiraceae bacterium]
MIYICLNGCVFLCFLSIESWIVVEGILVLFVVISMSLIEELKQIRYKPIFIPPEKGIWGFVIESLILGLVISEGVGKYFLAILLITFPFVKQNLKIFLQDVFSKRKFLRKHVAFLFLILFLIFYLVLLYFTYRFSHFPFWIFVLIAFGLGLLFVVLEIKGFYQHLLLEIAGTFLFVLIAASMSTTIEWDTSKIELIFMILGFRNLTSILLTRELIDYIKYRKTDMFWYILIASVIVSLMLYFYYFIHLPLLTIFLFYLFVYVIIYQLIKIQKIYKIQTLGWGQIILGILYVILCSFFYDKV